MMAEKKDRKYIQNSKIPLPKADYEDLIRKDYIYIQDDEVYITSGGRSLLKQLDSKPEIEDEFVDKYRELFSKSALGVPGKMGDRNGIKKKLEIFMSKYPFSEDQILEAAENYIQTQRENNYQYLQQADYFIFKQDNMKIVTSRLAEFCEQLGESDQLSWEVRL